jgi:hypothetical protein
MEPIYVYVPRSGKVEVSTATDPDKPVSRTSKIATARREKCEWNLTFETPTSLGHEEICLLRLGKCSKPNGSVPVNNIDPENDKVSSKGAKDEMRVEYPTSPFSTV